MVNNKQMFQRPMREGYAAPTYIFNKLAQLQAIVCGCAASNSPVIRKLRVMLDAGVLQPGDVVAINYGQSDFQARHYLSAESSRLC